MTSGSRVPATRGFLLPLASLVASLAAAACGSTEHEPRKTAEAVEQSVAFQERVTTPATSKTMGGLVTLRLRNNGPSAITVRDVLPVSDPHLIVTYLGHTTCERGCAGAAPDTPPFRRLVAAGVDGLVPFSVPPEVAVSAQKQPPVSIVFRLSIGAGGEIALQRGCLKVQEVNLQTQQLGPILATFSGGFVAALEHVDPKPSGYQPCT